ncbi:hypothetical protein BDE02_04G015600 [Populus trichocarpa]|nr:hypothetical protein BDE02_04G015600 [Populus trichocarpa]
MILGLWAPPTYLVHVSGSLKPKIALLFKTTCV